jgi:hypothetical protein
MAKKKSAVKKAPATTKSKKKQASSAGKPQADTPSRPAKAGGAGKAAAPARSTGRSSWLDDESNKPIIDRYARKLASFVETMADGRVDAEELAAQEARLVRLMKEVEPALTAELHEKVTRLLCELTAYDIMQILHTLEESRPKTQFVG